MLDVLIENGSYFGITLFMVLTGCGLPVPEEVPIITAGVLSGKGVLRPEFAFPALLVGAILGDCVMYGIGRRFGRSLVYKHPKFAHWMHVDREAMIEQKIRRHGLWMLVVARFMVGVRSPVYLTAGMLRVPFRRFLLLDLFSATAVVGVFFGLSYLFGDAVAARFQQVEVWLTVLVVLAILGGLGWYYMRMVRPAKAAGAAAPPAGSGADRSAG